MAKIYINAKNIAHLEEEFLRLRNNFYVKFDIFAKNFYL